MWRPRTLCRASSFPGLTTGRIGLPRWWSLREVEQDIELIPKPWDKMWQNRELVVNQLDSGTAIERFARRRPDVAEGLLARFRPPTIQRERP